MSERYILRGHKAVVEPDLIEWARWYETADRRVAFTKIGDREVSTVFLGVNYQFGHGAPLLFETMVFGADDDEICERYSTWDEAADGHARVAAQLRASAQ